MNQGDAEKRFIDCFNYFAGTVHRLACDKGWWRSDRNEGELIALIHSELSEALEALREDKDSKKIFGFLGIEEELADTSIRIMDYAEAKNYKVPEAILAKIKYNMTREYRHGGKKF